MCLNEHYSIIFKKNIIHRIKRQFLPQLEQLKNSKNPFLPNNPNFPVFFPSFSQQEKKEHHLKPNFDTSQHQPCWEKPMTPPKQLKNNHVFPSTKNGSSPLASRTGQTRLDMDCEIPRLVYNVTIYYSNELNRLLR